MIMKKIHKKCTACDKQFTIVRSTRLLCAACASKKWYYENYQRARKTRRQYRQKNHELCQQRRNIWKKNNSEREHLNNMRWYQEHKDTEQFKLYNRVYKYNREQSDINFKICNRIRKRLYSIIKNNQKTGSAVQDLGCSIAELRKHLQSQFQPGMTWDNYGQWHIDHIRPLSGFNLSNRKELLQACHYTNLQPLWAIDNLRKGTT
jgi:hypothetical protein